MIVLQLLPNSSNLGIGKEAAPSGYNPARLSDWLLSVPGGFGGWYALPMATGSGDLLDEIRRAGAGDAACWQRLLDQHHDRLRRMVVIRLDPRLRGRLDPSDVLQETYLDAARHLPDYLRRPEIPFHLWLRGLAGNRLKRLHRHHLRTRKRDAGRELSLHAGAPEASSIVLAELLLGSGEQPSEAARRDELHDRLVEMLDRLDPLDREALVLRHFEQMTCAEVGQILDISESAAGKRYLRALDRLRQFLAEAPGGLESWLP
jgi:RNA polymerase sigma-70 factor (ECF subfamily)